jgi:hypothetical protein
MRLKSLALVAALTAASTPALAGGFAPVIDVPYEPVVIVEPDQPRSTSASCSRSRWPAASSPSPSRPRTIRPTRRRRRVIRAALGPARVTDRAGPRACLSRQPHQRPLDQRPVRRRPPDAERQVHGEQRPQRLLDPIAPPGAPPPAARASRRGRTPAAAAPKAPACTPPGSDATASSVRRLPRHLDRQRHGPTPSAASRARMGAIRSRCPPVRAASRSSTSASPGLRAQRRHGGERKRPLRADLVQRQPLYQPA